MDALTRARLRRRQGVRRDRPSGRQRWNRGASASRWPLRRRNLGRTALRTGHRRSDRRPPAPTPQRGAERLAVHAETQDLSSLPAMRPAAQPLPVLAPARRSQRSVVSQRERCSRTARTLGALKGAREDRRPRRFARRSRAAGLPHSAPNDRTRGMPFGGAHAPHRGPAHVQDPRVGTCADPGSGACAAPGLAACGQPAPEGAQNRSPPTARSFERSCVALMRRIVPERVRVTSDSVVAPPALG